MKNKGIIRQDRHIHYAEDSDSIHWAVENMMVLN